MLFDLRGRGRRRTVQVVYISLALILGGGFVLLGVGGTGSGGILDAFKSDNQTSGATDQIDRDIKRAERRTQATPRAAAGWATLARLRYQKASVTGFDQRTGTYTDGGKKGLRAAGQAWNRYLALDPEQPNAQVAAVMVQAFSPGGLNELDRAVTAQEIVTEARTEVSNTQRSNLFFQLAALAYAAGQTDKGKLAGDRAVELAPKEDKKLVRQKVDQARDAAASQAGQTATTPNGATTAPAPTTTSP